MSTEIKDPEVVQPESMPVCVPCLEGLPHSIHVYPVDGGLVFVDESERIESENKDA